MSENTERDSDERRGVDNPTLHAPPSTLHVPPQQARVEPILAVQRRLWRHGESRKVETFLADHPELRDDDEARLQLIFQEVVLREEQGQECHLEEYQKRFPELAGQLEL